MSRVFSRHPGRRFPLLTARLGLVGGRGPSLGKERDGPRLALGKFARPARKLSIRPSPGRVALNHSGTKCGCKNCENKENSTKMGSGASAGECAAAAAGECVFGSVFADMAPPGTALLWPCLLMPMVKGTEAGRQQALAAQAEQRRIRGR